MKTLSQANRTVTKDAFIPQTAVKVCMHILGYARNDPRVLRAATALQEAGFAVSIVDIAEKRDQPVEEEIHGIIVKHILVPGSFMATRFSKWTILRTLWILIQGAFRLLQTPADIYHAHDVSGLPASYIAARLRHKQLIYDAHELPLSEMSNGLFRRMKPLLNWLLAGIISRCARVITVSPPIVREICNCYHASNVFLIRNMPPYQRIPESDRFRQFLGLTSDVRIALYQGNLTSGRGLARLIRAAAFLDQNVVMVMMGRGELEAELKALTVTEGLTDRVKILPPAPYMELLSWTASADVGLMVYSLDHSQNVQMCLPNKLFEYLMAGLPVLAARLDAVVDMIETYDVGQVVDSLTPEDIASAINSMLANRAAYDRMQHNALEASRQDLCWDKEKQRLIQLYDELLGMQIKEI